MADVNGAPLAIDDTVSGAEDAVISGAVLANDGDPDDDALSVVGLEGGAVGVPLVAALGTLTLRADGTFDFLAHADVADGLDDGETATASFVHTVADPSAETATATLAIEILGETEPRPPSTGGATATVDAGDEVLGNVIAPHVAPGDEDTLMVTAVEGGAVGASVAGQHGTLTMQADGRYSYVANGGATSTLRFGDFLMESFDYTLANGAGLSETVSLEIRVEGRFHEPVVWWTNTPPEARDDVAAVAEGAAVSGDVLRNDEDPDGHLIWVAGVAGGPADRTVAGDFGELLLECDGSWRYVSTLTDAFGQGRTEVDVFEYMITDEYGEVDVATLEIAVAGAGGTAGPDELVGTAGEDVLSGLGANDRILGRGGDDVLEGDAGRDALRGGGGDDRMSGGRGKDELRGGGGEDALKGRGGGDLLIGGRGADTLKGGGGRDELFGGKGSDKLAGNAGKDVFFFRRGDGEDVIRDWQDGRDLIEFGKGVSGFGDLDVSQKGAHLLVDYGRPGDVLKILRADAADLDAGDFVF